MRLFSIISLLIGLLYGPAFGDTQQQFDSLKAMGKLNGVALQCKYLKQVQKMKAAIVESAPPERSIGLAFDQASNDSFLAFLASGQPCPGPAGFEREVSQAIADMKAAFMPGS